MSTITVNRKQYLIASIVAIVLLSSSLLVPTFSAYAVKSNDKPKGNDHPKNVINVHDDHSHKKGKKDPDHDKDNDKKACKKGDTDKKGKYKKNCDSDHDFKK